MDFMIWLIIIWLGLMIASILTKRWLLKEAMKWDPFSWHLYMTTELKCDKCGWNKTRYWAKGDFVGKEIDIRKIYPKSQLKKHKKCDGKVFITGIYFKRELTEAERKYNELCRKWGDNKQGIYI